MSRPSAKTAPIAQRIFDRQAWCADQPLRVVLIGTDFEGAGVETSLRIPMGKATTYSTIAEKHWQADGVTSGRRGRRQESDRLRSAVPSRARQSGDLTGYHWGLTRKRAILGWEAGQVAS